MEKWITYAAQIQNQLAAMFDEDSDNYIDKHELNDEDNLKAFLHALSTAVPCNLFNKWTSEELDILEYNHIANKLIFEFAKK